MIYSYSLTDLEDLHINSNLRITTHNIPIVEVLLVNQAILTRMHTIPSRTNKLLPS